MSSILRITFAIGILCILTIITNATLIKFKQINQNRNGKYNNVKEGRNSKYPTPQFSQFGYDQQEDNEDENSTVQQGEDFTNEDESQNNKSKGKKASKKQADISQNPVRKKNNRNPVNNNQKKQSVIRPPRKIVKKITKLSDSDESQQQSDHSLDNQDDYQESGEGQQQKKQQDNLQESSQDTLQQSQNAQDEDYIDYDRSLQEGDEEDTGSDNSQDQQQGIEDQQQNQNQQQQEVPYYDTRNKRKLKKNFDQFNNQYAQNKDGDQSQVVLRFVIYSDAANKVNKHNSQKNRTYNIQINEYADETLQQFQSKYLMKNLGKQPRVKGIQFKLPQPEARQTLRPIDWNVRNATSPLKHQRQCGSCWAFSVLGALQSHIFLKKKGPLQWLSQQQLLDCCDQAGFGCKGCTGSWLGQPLNYLALQGVALYEEYPYVARPQYCVQGIKTKKYLNTQTPFNLIKGVDQLAYALLKGPVSIIVDSGNWDPLYKNGIFNHCPTSNLQYNHAGVLVARTKKGIWTIRNSWGPRWGEGGHIRLPPGNSCGIADWGVIPILQQ